jgi:glycosyltransferase involved in cell wall biosynthesis
MAEERGSIVSLTPTSMDQDTRTIKIASSLARFGFRSVVVENRPGGPNLSKPDVRVITLGRFGSRTEPGMPADGSAQRGRAPGSLPPKDALEHLRRVLGPPVPRWLRERAHLLVFAIAYFIIRPLQGIFQVPRGSLYYLHEYRLYPLVHLVRRLRPAPLIYDAHDYYPEVLEDASLSPFWRRRFQPLLGWMEQWCVGNADAVVTVGEGVARLFTGRYGVSPVILRNCHDSRIEREPSTTLREKIGAGADAFLVVVVGHRKPGQVIDSLIEALASLPEQVHLALVGRFHEESERTAERFGVQDQVHAVGVVRPEEIVPFIRSADVSALPYYPATRNVLNILPNGFFQSLAAHLPLLYPALPEIGELVFARVVGHEVDLRDPASVAAALRRMLEDEEALTQFRENAGLLATELSWEKEEILLCSLVDGLLGDSA